ncbi:hypothetical protein KMZ93_01745 [Bradyrhizobium sediminis]|uniref:Uncharacterized protein n=1 Tax=Bradyrhizobium sediminis TaxID=2840469 RepID=A0A975RY06_9BRAD|nr:hypothetical protein [Bradyrhizobium sediminis]QWG23698.1 hypothetical protein KMZ93_01745 [Bradyrhizobium sediminis]
MMKVPDPKRGVRRFGLAAGAMLVLTAATGQRAEALSLINPGAAPSAKYASDALTTEVKGGHGGGRFHGGGFHGGGFRGGGAAIHGGSFRSGGAVFRGGGYSAPHIYRGGGYRYGGAAIVRHHHFAPRRAYWHHRHHIRPRYYGYAPVYYPQRYDYPRRYCRIVWTYYGPRKICRYRPWHHHWRYRWRHRYPIYW